MFYEARLTVNVNDVTMMRCNLLDHIPGASEHPSFNGRDHDSLIENSHNILNTSFISMFF